ncbi:helix-turn-helix domain-containing protein [Peptostreptococcus porci]|uniref:helix-turn-helix domain-containing protein n=1 Tax=Peptostreptococcus porci TaxID=2652282 RepID=UPI0023F4979A|nr:helix-turn-helix transcriptional regulator [Peptostreptococcus porci]MDD7182354.1 helix-turn-helix transcriptional regulator [Peptostreptococcus porci]
MNLLGEYLKKYRIENELSLRQFAKLCDISHTHIDSIEKGVDYRTGKVVKVTNDTILKIANAINVKPDFLFNLSIGEQQDSSDIEDNSINDMETIAAHRTNGNNSDIKDVEGLKDLIRELINEEKNK